MEQTAKVPKKMNPAAFWATIVNIGANAALFAVKLAAALLSGSVALLSEAFNSLTDTVSSIAIFICVRISDKEADEGHPFGHKRAEPIAGLVVAIFAGILGFEIIRTSIDKIVHQEKAVVGAFALFVPLLTIVAKGAMSWYFRKVGREVRSPAIAASGVDSLCDVFVAVAALIGVVGAWQGYWWLDPAAGLVISIWILITGYRIGMENIDYLMGKAPPPEMLSDIRTAARSVGGVRDINTVRAHYVGHFIHVEVHIEVDKALSTLDSHAIGKNTERELHKLPFIEKAFIHIDPV
ncbi:MAG: cation diffusion facilitator family transporter [Deltaproteobacteria bacterium]|nr:cation diffusion facilitator family transporter [Deltaproteobacteria bacterium]